MSAPTPVRGLFETHLTVRDVPRSVAFYRDVVGLSVGLELPEHDAAFLWIGERGRSMLGLWGIGSAVNTMTLHIAFEVAADECSRRRSLRTQDVTPLSFFGAETDEPDVLAWMPAAAVYFEDLTVTCSSIWRCGRGAAPGRGHRALVGVVPIELTVRMIGAAGFEPAASASQTQRSTRLSYAPRLSSVRMAWQFAHTSSHLAISSRTRCLL